MEIESIFSQPVARFVLRVCISVVGYFARANSSTNIIEITKLEV